STHHGFDDGPRDLNDCAVFTGCANAGYERLTAFQRGGVGEVDAHIEQVQVHPFREFHGNSATTAGAINVVLEQIVQRFDSFVVSSVGVQFAKRSRQKR